VSVDGRKIDDARDPSEYLHWCHAWLDEVVRVLKPGGALYLYHVPKWNMRLGTYLDARGLRFGNWITVGINGQMPVRGKLLQHGYSLLYFTKGRPTTFHRVLTPLRRCRHCNGYVKDYGGKLRRFERRGGTCLSDVWDDVTAVRHRPYRSGPPGPLNQMSTKIVQRALAISTRRGDVVVDVFGGSGTTYAVAESMGRRWVGCEYGSCEAIRHRLSTDDVCLHPCDDIVRS
jgi:site-specific DNA-methyltransferase (adenine-specific)